MLLFCSDGISDNLVDADIAKLLSSGDVEYAAQNMLREAKHIASQLFWCQLPSKANKRAKDDDMTALVIKV
jgi:serine/threonine protein phosphatase PrpC